MTKLQNGLQAQGWDGLSLPAFYRTTAKALLYTISSRHKVGLRFSTQQT
jgi:hypothetical protein